LWSLPSGIAGHGCGSGCSVQTVLPSWL
jgi:hypothetical protein